MLTANRKQELQRKAAILKRHEVYAYQAAYYLLEDESLASEAAAKALMVLSQDDLFFAQPEPLQQKAAKLAVMKQALATKAAVLQPS